MMDSNILDMLFPVPKIEELKEQAIQDLQKEGFIITYFKNGGIFHILLMIILNLRIEFIKLMRSVLGQMYVSSADDMWLQLRAQDYSKTLKPAKKTEGKLLLIGSQEHANIVIPKGTIYKTKLDINGEELKFYTTKEVIFLENQGSVEVPIEAEKVGKKYNVAQGQITEMMIYIDGVEKVSNSVEWITIEGCDVEDLESLRERTLKSWHDLATGTTAQKYKNKCESVAGVLYVRVDDLHPRGQGTVDIIVTSAAGAATDKLLQDVLEAAEEIKGEYDNLLIKSAITVTQDINVIITLPKLMSEDGVIQKAESVIRTYFEINKNRQLNELIQVDLLYALKKILPDVKNIKITSPESDVLLEADKVIILGAMDVQVIREV